MARKIYKGLMYRYKGLTYRKESALLSAITQWDLSVLLFIQNNIRSDFWTPFWKFFSFLGNGGWFGIALCAALLIPRKTRKAGIAGLMAIVLTFILGEGIIKHLVNRPRPYETSSLIVPLVARLSSSSFPSGHTANAFAWAVTLGHYLPKKASIPLFLIACLIGLSRMYVGVHYPTDVMAGCLLGVLTALLTIHLIRAMERRKEQAAEQEVKTA